MYASSFIPDRTTVTSGWFHIHRRDHSAGLRFLSVSSQIAWMSFGGALAQASAPERLHDDDAESL